MTTPKCSICGEAMPPGEEMFTFHGYSGPCPRDSAVPMVRAKFRVTKLEQMYTTVPAGVVDGKQQWAAGTVVSIHASPVSGNGDPEHENSKFWHATPSGSLVLGTVNEEAAKQFKLGQEVYLDFTFLPPAG